VPRGLIQELALDMESQDLWALKREWPFKTPDAARLTEHGRAELRSRSPKARWRRWLAAAHEKYLAPIIVAVVGGLALAVLIAYLTCVGS
jgi:hypothetical protein